jgi:Mor family transcriptional regulator
MSKRLTEELKDAVVTDYLAGVTTREIIEKHKTYELYSILDERKIEYKQNNNKQKEKQKLVVDLYLNNIPVSEIIQKTGYKDVYKILKKFNISRNRDPKKYLKNKKEERNQQLIKDYFSRKYTIEELSSKYNMSHNNIYRIFKVYNIIADKNLNHHWVINQKVKHAPNIKCKFYILEDYYGHTKIGITTKNDVRKRYRKNINVFYEIDNTLEYCYYLEVKIKKILKSYIPKDIDKTIDGWSECYNLPSENVLEYVKSTVRETASV